MAGQVRSLPRQRRGNRATGNRKRVALIGLHLEPAVLGRKHCDNRRRTAGSKTHTGLAIPDWKRVGWPSSAGSIVITGGGPPAPRHTQGLPPRTGNVWGWGGAMEESCEAAFGGVNVTKSGLMRGKRNEWARGRQSWRSRLPGGINDKMWGRCQIEPSQKTCWLSLSL